MKRLLRDLRGSAYYRMAGALLAILFVGLAVHGQAAADNFVQSYSSAKPLQQGLVVSLTKNSSRTVELSSLKDQSRIFGVVINPNDAAITVGGQTDKVFVATSGQYPVLVSSEYGAIKSGDYVSLSTTNGIGARADTQDYIIGRALGAFDGKNNVLTTTSSGLAVGKVDVDIAVGKNPLQNKDIFVPLPLRRIGDAFAGKTVTAVRLYAAMALFICTFFVAGGLLWVSVRSGMNSIGRNPLSKHSIVRGLIQVLAIDVMVFIIGLFGVYLLLRT